MKKNLFISLILVLILSGCNTQNSKDQNNELKNSSSSFSNSGYYSSSLVSSESNFFSSKNFSSNLTQNFSSNSDISTNTFSSLKNTIKDNNYLYISELGIKIKLDKKTIDDSDYKIVDNIPWVRKIDKGANIYSKIYTDMIKSIGNECPMQTLSIGRINGTIDEYNKSVGEYDKIGTQNSKTFSGFFIVTVGVHEPCFLPKDSPSGIKEIEITQKVDPYNILNSIYPI